MKKVKDRKVAKSKAERQTRLRTAARKREATLRARKAVKMRTLKEKKKRVRSTQARAISQL
jgi:hypothetical protein